MLGATLLDSGISIEGLKLSMVCRDKLLLLLFHRELPKVCARARQLFFFISTDMNATHRQLRMLMANISMPELFNNIKMDF